MLALPLLVLLATDAPAGPVAPRQVTPRQVTTAATGHVLANRDCWSADSRWLLYDLRTDETVFDGRRIERVEVDSGRVETLYEAPATAACGVPTGRGERVVFLRSPAEPTPDWAYAPWHRFGMTARRGERPTVLDARDLAPPLTPGALRGGTHLHTVSPDGRRVASTYEDHLLATGTGLPENRRVVAVTWPERRVAVSADHPRDQDGGFTVVATAVTDEPTPGSDEIARAYSDAWLPDSRRIAFFGEVRGAGGEAFSEVFVVDLPDEPTAAPGRPLEGTPTTRPNPPAGARQTRLTFIGAEPNPGVAASPRHWPVSSPAGEIAFLRRDADDRLRFCLVDRRGGPIRWLTNGRIEPTSAFTWSPDGARLAFVGDGSVCTVDVASGRVDRLTPPAEPGPTHHACVFSPDGTQIAYMQRVGAYDQLFVVDAATSGPEGEAR
ncbi:DUF3748 domain-containing protein [Alienimonas californiensis]|uniref:Translocation protein TolB n=1 Tax=Alienimonas californiensis TaxID=2527989 RepID=A0A517P6K8_9PLAN|nr:DUF3748 domain-containing protein [Alienimonas californiensis]QDT15018.1 translocation protein TolB [Alienimonas californiensis]